MTYPLHLDLTGRRVVVVGAGRVAARRIAALLDGAPTSVVAPDATPAVADLAAAGRLTWHRRAFEDRTSRAPGSCTRPPTTRP